MVQNYPESNLKKREDSLEDYFLYIHPYLRLPVIDWFSFDVFIKKKIYFWREPYNYLRQLAINEKAISVRPFPESCVRVESFKTEILRNLGKSSYQSSASTVPSSFPYVML